MAFASSTHARYRRLRSADTHVLLVCRTNNNFGVAGAPRLGNNMPPDLKEPDTADSQVRQMQKRSYFGQWEVGTQHNILLLSTTFQWRYWSPNTSNSISSRHNCFSVKSVALRFAVGYGDQLLTGGRFHSPTSRFPFSRRQWSLLNRFRTGQGHCGTCRKKLGSGRQWKVCLRWHPDNVTYR